MRRRSVVILIGVAAFAGTSTWYLGAQGRDAEMLFSGTIESDDIRVGSLVGGRVQTVDVEEGATVEAGSTRGSASSRAASRPPGPC